MLLEDAVTVLGWFAIVTLTGSLWVSMSIQSSSATVRLMAAEQLVAIVEVQNYRWHLCQHRMHSNQEVGS